jgi:hypothetical protein
MTGATMTTTRSVFLVLVTALGLLGGAVVLREDDRPVDPTGLQARAAIEAARAIVPGELVDVRRDVDDAYKWEVTLHAFGNDYEVELEPATLALLRIDYD